MGSHRAVALAVCLLLGTAARGDEEPPKTSLEAAPGSPGVVRKSELMQLLALTDRMAGQLSKLRGLPLKHPFKHGLHSRQEILEYVIQQMDRHEPPAKLAADELALRELGVIGPGDDYRKLLLEVLSEQIAGFYDPSAQTLYVADWIPAQAQSITLAHEIGHALQDQSFPLEAFVAEDKGNTDLTLARQALVEGDGVAQMILFQMMLNGITADVWADGSMGDRLAEGMANESKQGSPALMRAPLYLRESLLFPYVTGLRFVSALRKGKAWDAVDAGFRAPPASTEQVMHPEKYFAHEQPVEVRVAAPPSLAAWTRVYDDVMGEAGFLFWFRQLGVPERVAERAAAGWGGDRLVVFKGPAGQAVAILRTVWDTEPDAIEAQAAAAQALARRTAHEAPAKTALLHEWPGAAGARFWTERRGKEVQVVFDAPADLAAALHAELWAPAKEP